MWILMLKRKKKSWIKAKFSKSHFTIHVAYKGFPPTHKVNVNGSYIISDDDKYEVVKEEEIQRITVIWEDTEKLKWRCFWIEKLVLIHVIRNYSFHTIPKSSKHMNKILSRNWLTESALWSQGITDSFTLKHKNINWNLCQRYNII